MGLASIFLGLGLLGLLLSLCTVCVKQKKSKEKLVFRQKEVPRNEDRITSLYNSIQETILIKLYSSLSYSGEVNDISKHKTWGEHYNAYRMQGILFHTGI